MVRPCLSSFTQQATLNASKCPCLHGVGLLSRLWAWLMDGITLDLIMEKPTQVQRPSEPSPIPRGSSAPHHDHISRNVQHKEALRLALGSILAPKRPYTSMSRSTSASGTASPALPLDPTHAHTRPGSSLAHTHPHLHHPHQPSHPSRLGRPHSQDVAVTSPPPAGLTPAHPLPHHYSHPQHLPYFLTHTPTIPASPPHSGPPSGASTPPTGTSCSSAATSPMNTPPASRSPALNATQYGLPMSVPEDEPLQMLPPVVAALPGSSSPAAPVRPMQSLVQAGQDSANSDANAHASDAAVKVPQPDQSRNGKLKHVPPGVGGTSTPRVGFIETLQSKNSAWDALIHGSFS
ncbi:hypothetical protein AX17_003040 [Amanita inopinata Kibby_2008]|nr:hypothetical protein AX17_003040 [Amanita inopinata Kibby_2008]